MRKKFLLMTFLTLLFTAMGTNLLRAENGNVAKVGDTEYAKLADAVNAAQADDDIKVIADIATNLDLTISKKVTLDLGGFTLSDAGIKIESDVTIKNGKIVNTNEPYPLKVTGSGNLTVDGVAIEASKSDRAIELGSSSVLNFKSGSSILATKGINNTYSKIYGVWVSQGATANIYGGTITVDAGADATAVAIFGNYDNNTVNIYGGKISTSGKNYSYAVYVYGDVTITGGEIVTNEKQYGYPSGITYGFNYAIYSKGDVEISGETKITTYGPKGYIVNAGGSKQKVNIADGEFTNVLSEADTIAGGHSKPNLIYGSSVDATIAGGDFNGYKGEELIKGTGSTLTITGGSFDNMPKADYVAVGATITVGETTYTKTEDGLEEVIPVASVNGTSYTSLEAAFEAATEGQTITLLADATPALTSQRAITKAAVIDLGGKTLTLTEDDLYFGTTEFKNGSIIVDQSVKPSTAVFWMFANQTLTFDNVKIVATGVTGTYLIGLDGNNSDLNLLNGSEIVVENTTALDLDIICVNASTGNDIKVENSKVNVTNLDGRVFFRGNYTVKDSEVNLAGITKAGFRIEAGQTLSIEGTSVVNITGELRDGGIHLTDLTATYTVAETATVNATVNQPVAVAQIGTTKYGTLQEAIDDVQNGETIELLSDVTENVTLTEKTDLYYTINGSDKTMNGKITVNSLSDTNDNRRITIKNIKFVDNTDADVDFISSVETNHYPRLTVEGCTFTGSGNNGDVAVRLKSSHSVVIKYCTGTGLHSFLQNTSGWNLTINNVTVTNSKSGLALGTVQGVTVIGSNIDVNGYGIRLDAQYNNSAVIESNVVEAFIPVVVRKAEVVSSITFSGTNTMTASNTDGLWCAIGTSEYETNGTMPTAPTGQVTVTLNGTGLSMDGVYGAFFPVKIGETGYATLAAAAAAAQAGETITLFADVTEDVTLPAGITLNGNGKAVGNIIAAGTITFNGHTKATSFNVKNTNTTVNIVEGACLEITGTGRMVIGHGCTFNITGTITDAKNANVADLTPSLIMPGASFTGAGVTFNVTNAYISAPSSYCSSSSSASGTFDFNITNSIWESAGKLAFESQSTAATVNFDLVESVLNTGSHLVFGVSRGEVVIDNSNVNVGTSRQIENQSTMTVKNGSVVNGAVATSSNAKNPGTLIVDNATYAVTGEFSGSDLGTGTLIIKKGANVSVGSITAGANVVVDAEGMAAGDDINFTADLSQFTGTLSVINNDNLEAKIINGKIVLVEKPEAKIGETEYATLQEAVNAAQDGEEIDLLKNVELTSKLLLTKNNILDGNGFKLTPAEGFTYDGNNAVIVLAANMSGYEANRPYTVKNLTIEGFSTPSRIVRANFCDATIQNCLFNNNTSESIITSAYAVLNVVDNIFTDNTATGYAVINVGSDVSDGTNLVAKIIDNTFENNQAAIAGIYLASSADVTGNHFKDNTHTGDNANAAAILAGPYTGNMAYTVNINSNAFENAMSKDDTALPSVFAEDWSANYGSTTSFDLSLNYWDGNKPVAGTAYKTSGDNPQVTVASYYTTYTDGTLGGLVELPQGNQPIGYVSETTIWGQTWANAKESYVIKVLNEGNEVMGTSALNTSLDVTMDGDVEVTWHITLPGITDGDQYWIQEWTADPSIYNMPAKVALLVDGVEVNEGPVKLNGPDDIDMIYAAVTDEDGKIYSYHTSIADAITAINNNNTRSVTPNVIALLRNTDETVTLPAGIKLNLNGHEAPNVSVPVAQIGETPYYTLAEAVAAAQSGATITLLNGEHELPLFAGKELTFKGESKDGVIVNDAPAATTQGWNGSTFHFENLTAKGATANYHGLANGVVAVTYKDCNINGLRFLYATEGVSFDGCAFNAEGVEHSFWTYGASNVTVNNCTFTYTDRAVNCYSEDGANHELDITFTGCTFTYADTNATSEGAVEINSSSVKSINLVMNGCTAPENGAMWFISQWDSKNGANTVVTVDGVVVWTAPAKIGETRYATLQEALNAAAAGTGNITVEILDDINLTNVDWNPVTVSAPGYPLVTVEGNGKTITGLNDMLFAGTWAGNSGLIIKNLTIEDSNIVHDVDDSAGNIGVGAFIGFPQASATITLNNCHLVNSTVNGGHWTGGLIGMAGGYNGNDGPVFMNLTIEGCSVTGSIITGKGSCGGIIGHGSCAAWTALNIKETTVSGNIKETTVSGNTITSTGTSNNKAGAIMGTIGAAGQPTTVNGVTHTGGAMVSATVADNTVTSGGTTITTIYGRQGTDTGILELNGGTYDKYPIEENVAYAKPAAGLMIELNDNGTYGLVEDPAYGKVAMIGETYYETLSAAFAAVTGDEQTVVILSDVTEKLEGAYLRGNITTKDGTKVTITLTNVDWVPCPYTFILGENITLNVPALFYYAGGAQINGTVVAGAYYQRNAGTKLTINEPGSMKVTTETFIVRYMDADPNAGIYIIGDNNDETIGLDASVIYFYQGMINAKDADIKVGTYWQTNETDNQGSANLVLDNSNMTVTVNEHNMKATANSTVTLTNGSNVTVAGGYQGVGVSIDATSSMTMARSIFVSKINNYHYTSLQEAVNVGGEVTVLQDITLTEGIVIPADKTVTLDLAGCTVKQEKAQTTGYAMITNVGTLTIKDSSNPSTGKLSYKDTGDGGDGSFASNTIQNHGHLTILGGRIENLSEGQVVEVGYPHAIDHGNYSTVYTVEDVTLDIQGGTISNAHYSAIRMFCNSTTYRCDATISGGTIENAIDFQLPNAGKLLGSLTITGGTFNNINGKTTSVRMFAAGNANDGTGMIASIEGGTFNGTVGVITQLPVPVSFNTKVIKGGKFSATAAQNTSEDFLAEGFAFNDTPDANGYYTVIQIAGTQTREFAYPGWYWFSTYIDFESGEDGLDELQEQLGDNAATIKGQKAFTNYQYYNGVPFWTSALTSISASEMYMIKTTNECLNQDEQIYENVSVSLEGVFVDYENYEITIHEGWNWIGYPLNTEVSVRDALAGFTPAIGDQIKGKTQGSTSTYMSTNKWVPNFNMIPGEGYMYRSTASENKILTYSAGNGGTQNAKTSVEDNHWIVDEYKYSNNMTVIAMLSIDGEIVKGNYEVAAFANGECRGSARPIYIESIDAYVLFMTIHGDEVEELTFMYYDIDKDTEYELSNVMNYSNDAIVGTIDNPYIFSMNILGIGENSIDNINIYPNPTTTDREINLQAICDKVEVFNALGVKVAEYHNVDTLDALETAGIYVIRITNDNAVKHCRLVVK